MYLKDTIAAIATPNGIGAIAIIRISGSNSIKVCDSIFKSKNKNKKLIDQPSHTIHFGIIYVKNDILDEVLISIFKKPNSFTGEDSIEISCHASPYIQNKILEILYEKGIRPAEPGEFTFRAFINGNLDLIQAESISDLIASESKSAHQLAINQMKGFFSTELNNLYNKLIHCSSLIELELDFSEENITFVNRNQLKNILKEIKIQINHLINSYKLGNVLKLGVSVVIVGRPNVGKSTLMNAILNENRSIVSSIPGTTRDSIEEIINLEGIQFRLIDTAGIHKTNNIIESLGIQKSYEKIKNASIILYMYNEKKITNKIIINDLISLKNKNAELIFCKNKIDLSNTKQFNIEQVKMFFKNINSIEISAKNKQNLNILNTTLINVVTNNPYYNNANNILTNTRHLNLLLEIKKSINIITNNIQKKISEEILAFNLKNALDSIGKLIGKTIDIDKDILGTIFKNFCIGK